MNCLGNDDMQATPCCDRQTDGHRAIAVIDSERAAIVGDVWLRVLLDGVITPPLSSCDLVSDLITPIHPPAGCGADDVTTLVVMVTAPVSRGQYADDMRH